MMNESQRKMYSFLLKKERDALSMWESTIIKAQGLVNTASAASEMADARYEVEKALAEHDRRQAFSAGFRIACDLANGDPSVDQEIFRRFFVH